MRFTAADESYEIASGQLMVVSSMVPHSTDTTSTGEKTTLFVLMIPRRYIREYDKVLSENSFAIPFMTDEDNMIKNLIHVIFDFYPYTNRPRDEQTSFSRFDGNTGAYEASMHHTCSLIMNIVVRKCGLVPKSRTSAAVTRAVEYIEDNFREDINVSKLAKVLFTNRQELSTRFHEMLGMSIIEYISRLRTNEAARLLRSDPTLTVDSVRELSGFGSTRSFLRDFRRDFSCTPTEYRGRTAASEKQAE